MARVEKQADMKKQLEQVKGEVVKQVKHSTRTRRPWLACGLLVFLAVGGFVLWLVWTAASTGLVRVPGISTLAYKVPEPTRVVESGIPTQTHLQEGFAALAAQQAISEEAIEAEFSVTEQMLTSSLREAISESEWKMFGAGTSQVIIDEGASVNVFLPLAKRTQSNALQIDVLIAAVGGEVSVQIQEIQIGSYSIPGFVVANFIEPTLRRELHELNSQLTRYVHITSITTSEAEVTITGTLTAEVESPL